MVWEAIWDHIKGEWGGYDCLSLRVCSFFVVYDQKIEPPIGVEAYILDMGLLEKVIR